MRDCINKQIEKINTIQNEHAEWEKHNFPNSEYFDSVFGIVEEIGEFINALRSWDKEAKKEAKKDAIGDILIFIISFCTHSNFKFSELWHEINLSLHYSWIYQNMRSNIASLEIIKQEKEIVLSISQLIGEICHLILKNKQKIRQDSKRIRTLIRTKTSLMLIYLKELCTLNKLGTIEVIEEVWEKVKQRDWVNEPNKNW